MPNILVYGFMRGSNGASSLKIKIDRIIQGAGLAGDAITTFIYNSEPVTCDGKHKPAPFLEIRSDDEVSLESVSGALEQLGLDIEEMPILRRFKPGKKPTT